MTMFESDSNISIKTLVLITIFLIGGVLYFLPKSARDEDQINSLPASLITNFEECIAAGYPALESYPRQCNTALGQHFVEEIGELEIPKENSTTTNETACSKESREGEVCPSVFLPVCGLFETNIRCFKAPCGQTYSNSCIACHDERVESFAEGSCEDLDA